MEMSLIIQFENLISSVFSRILKIRIYKTILPVFPVGVKSGFLFQE